MTLGSPEWTVYIARRGGSPIVHDVDSFSDVRISRVVDNAGTCDITIPPSGEAGSANCEILADIEPWRDELVVYRGNDLAFVGPVESIDTDGRVRANDLFKWMSKRFISHDLLFDDDISFAFEGVFNAALAPDPSPNIGLSVHEVGFEEILSVNKFSGAVEGLVSTKVRRAYKGKDYHRASDLLGELARTVLDFTTIGRTVYVGGADIVTTALDPLPPIPLTDGDIINAVVSKDGSKLATDVAVFCGSTKSGQARGTPLIGRASASIQGPEGYGLVQETYTELLIEDLATANVNSLSRLRSVLPVPITVKADLAPNADVEFSELVPGRRFDVRLSSVCIPVDQVMRLASVDIERLAGTETISVNLIPLGVFASDQTS